MHEHDAERPWKAIESLVHDEQGEELQVFLDTMTSGEVARAISRLDEEDQAHLLTLLEPEDAADLVEELPDAQGADIMEDLPAEQAAHIIGEMDSDHRVDLLGAMPDSDAEAILEKMDPEEAEKARQLLEYPPDTAGGIMVTEFVVYSQDLLTSDVLNDLRTNAELYSDIGVQYAYVHTDSGTLVGVLRLRDLVLAPNDRPIREVMIVNPISVLVDAPLNELKQTFDRYMFMGIPVIDDNGHMVGVVERADAEEAHSERSERTFMQFSGIIGGEEIRTLPFLSRAMGRLSWLSINLVLSIAAASVIILYERTIEQITALAVLIPVLANVSGCTGNQAVAVSIRELSLGIIRPRDFTRVLRQELAIGLVNGVVLGALLMLFVVIWKDHLLLGIVVGISLAINTVLAVVLGAGIPLLLRRLNIDPASAAAPMLTTVVDVCGFFLILFLATTVLL